jgi:hypothetical protein
LIELPIFKKKYGEKYMNDKFAEFYRELNEILKKHSGNGMSHEEIIGGLESAKLYVSFLLEEEYKRRAVVASWEETKKQFEPKSPDLPLVEDVEDN